MRKVNVYYGDVYAGQLVELSRGNYEFTYDDAFRADGSTPPVSGCQGTGTWQIEKLRT